MFGDPQDVGRISITVDWLTENPADLEVIAQNMGSENF